MARVQPKQLNKMKSKFYKFCSFANPILGGANLTVLLFGKGTMLTVVALILTIVPYTIDFIKANGTRST